MDLKDPALYQNRELSWMEFNQRVLEEAMDERNPLLERLKFLAIVSSNLDEFFMVRVAGVQQQVNAGVTKTQADGIVPADLLRRVVARCHRMVDEQYQVAREVVLPRLRHSGIRLILSYELNDIQNAELERYFVREIFPVLSPLAIDPGHPLPHLRNLSFNLVVTLRQPWVSGAPPLMAVVEVPDVLDRFIRLPASDGSDSFILLEDAIAPRVGQLFKGYEVESCSAFRLTRNGDLNIDEDEAEDLLRAIEQELREREKGNPVRIEIQAGYHQEAVGFLIREMGLCDEDVYPIDGPLNLKDFFRMVGLPGYDHLRDRAYVAPIPVSLREEDEDIFSRIRRGDILMHHPYESFLPVVDFVERAAIDRAIGADLDCIADDHAAQLRDLLPAVGGVDETESVGADDGAGEHFAVAPEHALVLDGDTRMQARSRADRGARSDVRSRFDERAIFDGRTVVDGGEGADVHVPAQAHRRTDRRGRVHAGRRARNEAQRDVARDRGEAALRIVALEQRSLRRHAIGQRGHDDDGTGARRAGSRRQACRGQESEVVGAGRFEAGQRMQPCGGVAAHEPRTAESRELAEAQRRVEPAHCLRACRW